MTTMRAADMHVSRCLEFHAIFGRLVTMPIIQPYTACTLQKTRAVADFRGWRVLHLICSPSQSHT